MSDTDTPMTLEASGFRPPIPTSLFHGEMSEVIGLGGLDLSVLSGDLSLEEFGVLGKWVQFTANGSPWWEGDWGNYGEDKYGIDYLQAIEIEWSSDAEHARRRVTCGQFPIDTRHIPQLDFEHHAIVVSRVRKAPDLTKARHNWLDRAESEGWTPAQLAKNIRDDEAIEVREFGDDGDEDDDLPDLGVLQFVDLKITWRVRAEGRDAARAVAERMESVGKMEMESAGCVVAKVTGVETEVRK